MDALMLVALTLMAFFTMAKGWLRQEVAMPLVALLALALAPPEEAAQALTKAFAGFARIAVLFTAVAVPAHALERAGALNWLGLLAGQLLGTVMVRLRLSSTIAVPGVCLLMTYVMAGLFHNTTAILVCARIITTICESYSLRALPILCGALVASNLGGFSSKTGDTPNIREAELWGLAHLDFLCEILLINIGALLLLWAAVTIWLRRGETVPRGQADEFVTMYAVSRFRRSRLLTPIDRRGLTAGVVGIMTAILGPMIAPAFELGLSALAIVVTTLGARAERRSDTLLALGVETYATLCSIFVLAHVLTDTSIGIGDALRGMLTKFGMSIWAIAVVSYLGTTLTEAASWVTAAGPMIHAAAPGHAAAWALGAGICAGSSSLVTAASAGIILTRETEGNKPEARVSFASYLRFGLSFSLLMLAYYIAVLTAVWRR